jgi:hypothetical protein
VEPPKLLQGIFVANILEVPQHGAVLVLQSPNRNISDNEGNLSMQEFVVAIHSQQLRQRLWNHYLFGTASASCISSGKTCFPPER